MSSSRTRSPRLEPATMSKSRGIRYLHLGTPWVQGAMRISKPDHIELEYVQRMMVWMLARPIDAWRGTHAVQLGLGAAALTKFCHRRLGMQTVAVEVNPSVVEVCRNWFELPPDGDGLQVVQADARTWIGAPTRHASIDALCVDLYDHEAASPVLDDAGFYADCHQSLREGGLMTVNLFGREASFDRSLARIAWAFGQHNVVSLKPTKEGNAIVLATRGADWPDEAELQARALAIRERLGLPAPKWLKLFSAVPGRATAADGG